MYKDEAGTHFGKIEKVIRGALNDEKYLEDKCTMKVWCYDCYAEFRMYDGTSCYVGIVKT